jgi:hypothetical protein
MLDDQRFPVCPKRQRQRARLILPSTILLLVSGPSQESKALVLQIVSRVYEKAAALS